MAKKIGEHGHKIINDNHSFFDTIVVKLSNMEIEGLKARAIKHNFNLMYHENGLVGISLDEKTSRKEIDDIATLFENELTADYRETIFKPNRKSSILSHPIFHSINSETEMPVGHGRQAILGDMISNILTWKGYVE